MGENVQARSILIARGGDSSMVRISIPVYLPHWASSFFRGVKRQTKPVDLFGDREVEWSFVVSRLGQGPGEVLDFGSSFGILSIAAARRGFHVLALDWTMTGFRGDIPT